jgi:putative ABC transport system permease protein
VRALDRKLLRDVYGLGGQVLTIALVIAVGIGSYVALISTYGSLLAGRDVYYADTGFADVFASLEQAPNGLEARIEAISGVARVETRVVKDVLLPMEGLPEPALGRVIGWPSRRPPNLDRIVLRAGRMPDPDRADEVVVLESFVTAHHLRLGDTVPVVLNGILRQLRVVGSALSPEYVYPVGGGTLGFGDPERFCVLWMDDTSLAAAFRMEGAFDDVAIALEPGANERAVIDRLDALLKPYGGFGAYPRARQISNFFVTSELSGLDRLSGMPLLFLGVGAFLLNVVLSRFIQLQRGEIAVLKAVGYSNREVGLHVLSFAGATVTLGAVLGLAIGALMAKGMLILYRPFFHFPSLTLHLDASVMARSVVVSAIAGVLGAASAVFRVVRLPPAEAMRPEAPPTYRPSWLERLGLGRLFDPVGRMVLRELLRRPLRTSLNVLGVALAIAVAMTGRISYDMLGTLETVQFETAQREDLAVSFRHVLPDRARSEIAHLPGVLAAEPMRSVPIRVRSGPRFRDVALTGLAEGSTLRRIVEWPLRTVPVPAQGITITDVLAQLLDVRVGDEITIEVLEGSRQVHRVRIGGLVHDLFGLNVYASLPSLHALLGETEGISTVLVRVDPAHAAELDARLRDLPSVASVDRRRTALQRFREQSEESLSVMSSVLTAFGVIVALGVVYNAARVALSTRARDLATLRVLGFRVSEIAAVLSGELAAYVVLAIAPGIVLGQWAFDAMMGEDYQETFRMPMTASGLTYGFAVATVAFAAIVTAGLVRRRLARLDLTAVLKARE